MADTICMNPLESLAKAKKESEIRYSIFIETLTDDDFRKAKIAATTYRQLLFSVSCQMRVSEKTILKLITK